MKEFNLETYNIDIEFSCKYCPSRVTKELKKIKRNNAAIKRISKIKNILSK